MLAAGGGSSGEGGRKRRQEACALGFLSESLIVVCQRGQGSFSWLALPLRFTLLLSPQLEPPPAATGDLHQKSRFARRESERKGEKGRLQTEG